MDFLESIALMMGAAYTTRALRVTFRSNHAIAEQKDNGDLPFLSIIVPARNEERQIEQCVRSLLAQQYSNFEVIVVDDRSSDRTLQILERIAASDPRLRVIHGDALPSGWIGKPWALAQGAQVAQGSWLLFTDADTTHEPLAASSAVKYALESQARIVSLLPTQRFDSAAEYAVLPTILWMLAFGVGSLDDINDPKRTNAAIFNGQYLLFERNAYDALGGHHAVRDCIAEDYEFARIVKRDGRFRSRLAAAPALVSTRMYRSLREIWDGFSKNLYIAAEREPLRALVGTSMLAALSPLPEILLFRAIARRDLRAAVAMASAIACAAAATEVGMRRFHFRRGSGAFFPIGVAASLAIFFNSVRLHRTGRVQWRGRSYGRRMRSPGTQT